MYLSTKLLYTLSTIPVLIETLLPFASAAVIARSIPHALQTPRHPSPLSPNQLHRRGACLCKPLPFIPTNASPSKSSSTSSSSSTSLPDIPSVDDFTVILLGVGAIPTSFLFYSEIKTDPATSSWAAAKAYAAAHNLQLLPSLLQISPDHPRNVINGDAFMAFPWKQRQKWRYQYWTNASIAFARMTEGSVRVILKGPVTDGVAWPNNGVRGGYKSYWEYIEWPVLVRNPKVSTVTRISADDPTQSAVVATIHAG